MEKARRRNKLKRNRKKENRRTHTVWIVLGIVFFAVIIFFGIFRVTDVKIAGNTRYPDETILQYVQNDFLTTNTVLTSWFRKNMKVENIPFVESLDIEVLDKNTIRIYVNEKQTVGYIVGNEQKLFFDKYGQILEIMPMTETELEDIRIELERFAQLGMEEEDASQEEDVSQDQEGMMRTYGDGEGEIDAAPQVPWILGLSIQNISKDDRIIVEDTSVFNTIQGIWRISSKYEVIPERVLLDKEHNITMVYQNGTLLCQLGKDMILEEKITRVAAILPNLVDKIGILHLEDYTIGTDGIIFSQESEYTVMSKINRFLQKNS